MNLLSLKFLSFLPLFSIPGTGLHSPLKADFIAYICPNITYDYTSFKDRKEWQVGLKEFGRYVHGLVLEGERKTRYFHTATIARRAKKRILSLKDEDGNRRTDAEVLKGMAREFYQKLYTAEPCLPCQLDGWAFPQLSHADRRWLNRSVSPLEIKEAVFHMVPYKAPGPDGAIPLFYLKFFHIIGDSPIRRFSMKVRYLHT